MSWDIFVQDIPVGAQTVDDVPDDFKPRPLGSRAEVLRRIREVVPNADFTDPSWGTFEGPGFSVEFNIGGADEVESFVMHVRGSDGAAGFVADLLIRCGWRAFDTATGTGIFDPTTALESLQSWMAYRERVVKSHDAG